MIIWTLSFILYPYPLSDMSDLPSEYDCNFVWTDMGVEFTIMLAGWNASNAKHQGILVRNLDSHCSIDLIIAKKMNNSNIIH